MINYVGFNLFRQLLDSSRILLLWLKMVFFRPTLLAYERNGTTKATTPLLIPTEVNGVIHSEKIWN